MDEANRPWFRGSPVILFRRTLQEPGPMEPNAA